MLDIGATEGPNYSATRADFRVARGADVRTVSAERRFYPTAAAPTTEVGILSDLDGDLYLALGEPAERGSAAWIVRLYHNPLVQFIFGGVLLMTLGGGLSLAALLRRRGEP